MVGLITNKGKNMYLDRIYNLSKYKEVKYYQLGMSGIKPTINDYRVISPIPIITSSRVIIDDCESIAGWAGVNDTTNITLNTTAGRRLNGDASINIEAVKDLGLATAEKTFSSFSLLGRYLFLAVYLNAPEKIKDIYLNIGSDNENYTAFLFKKENLQSGWNALVIDVLDAYGIAGDGANITNITYLSIDIEILDNLENEDLIIDWLHSYLEIDTYRSFEDGTPTQNELEKNIITKFAINSTEANGYIIREVGYYDKDKLDLYRRDNFSSISKDQFIVVKWELKDRVI